MTPAQQLRRILAEPGGHVVLGRFDALAARLARDTGPISLSEMVDTLRNRCAADRRAMAP